MLDKRVLFFCAKTFRYLLHPKIVVMYAPFYLQQGGSVFIFLMIEDFQHTQKHLIQVLL